IHEIEVLYRALYFWGGNGQLPDQTCFLVSHNTNICETKALLVLASMLSISPTCCLCSLHAACLSSWCARYLLLLQSSDQLFRKLLTCLALRRRQDSLVD